MSIPSEEESDNLDNSIDASSSKSSHEHSVLKSPSYIREYPYPTIAQQSNSIAIQADTIHDSVKSIEHDFQKYKQSTNQLLLKQQNDAISSTAKIKDLQKRILQLENDNANLQESQLSQVKKLIAAENETKSIRSKVISLLDENNKLHEKYIGAEKMLKEFRSIYFNKETALSSQVKSYKDMYESAVKTKKKENINKIAFSAQTKKTVELTDGNLERRVFDMKQKRKSIEYLQQLGYSNLSYQADNSSINRILSPRMVNTYRKSRDIYSPSNREYDMQ
jgi:hypothetical protein